MTECSTKAVTVKIPERYGVFWVRHDDGTETRHAAGEVTQVPQRIADLYGLQPYQPATVTDEYHVPDDPESGLTFPEVPTLEDIAGLNDLKVPHLREVAEHYGIELEGAKGKAAVLDIVQASLRAKIGAGTE